MKTSVMGDPAWGGAISNLFGMLDPKAAAEGSALQARTRNFDSETRYNDARTGMVTDRRNALTTDALLKAGYTPRQIAVMQATQSDRVSDVFAGVQTDKGTQLLEQGGDPVQAALLLGQGNAADNVVKARSMERLLGMGAGQTFNSPLAAAVAGGTHELGGNVVTLGADGRPILGPVTAEGGARVNLFNTQATNDTSRTNSQNSVDKARGDTIIKTGDAMVDLRGAQTSAVTQGAEDKTKLTQAQIDDLVAKGVDRRLLTGEKINTEKAQQGKINTQAEANKAGSAVDNATKQGNLRNKIDRTLDSTYSKRTNNGKAWALLDAEEKRSIVDYATEAALDNGGNYVAAIAEAEAAHNLAGGTTEGETGWILKDKDGVLKLNGFKRAKYQKKAPASPIADAVAPTSPAAPAAEGVEPMPTEKAKLVVGKSYNTPKGVLKWTGEKFVTP